jgi:hypothetical protein
MNTDAWIFILIFIVAAVIFLLVFALALVGFVALLFFLGKANRSARLQQVESIVRNWTEQHGYELLNISEEGIRNSPFADRFGAGFGKRPAIVRSIEAKDPKGRVRRGWIYIRARFAGPRGFSGFLPDTLEVAWAN